MARSVLTEIETAQIVSGGARGCLLAVAGSVFSLNFPVRILCEALLKRRKGLCIFSILAQIKTPVLTCVHPFGPELKGLLAQTVYLFPLRHRCIALVFSLVTHLPVLKFVVLYANKLLIETEVHLLEVA